MSKSLCSNWAIKILVYWAVSFVAIALPLIRRNNFPSKEKTLFFKMHLMQPGPLVILRSGLQSQNFVDRIDAFIMWHVCI